MIMVFLQKKWCAAAMSQYKGYYTAGSSRGGSQEAGGNRFFGGTRGESQEQDCTEYDNGDDGTEYDPGGTAAMFDNQLLRSNLVVDNGKRSHDEADLHNGRVVNQVQQPQKLLKTSNGAFSRYSEN